MTDPLALVFHRQTLAGNQLVNRLHDLKYRMALVGSVPDFAFKMRTAGVMLVLVEVETAGEDLWQTIRDLRADEATRHLPVIAFASSARDLEAARQAGCTMALEAPALLAHLPAVLEQALQMD